MKIFFFLFFSTLLFSQTYYSKVEPYELRTIYSNVSGIVTHTKEMYLGQILPKEPYIEIDNELDIKELQNTKNKIQKLQSTLKLTEKVLTNLSLSLERKKKNYNAINAMSIKSQLEKDREFYNLISAKNQYFNTKKEINNLKMQLSDSLYKLSRIEKVIKDKKISNKNFMLYSLLVKKNQFVNFATPLAKIADVSKAKLTIYLSKEDFENRKLKTIYIDNHKTQYKISRAISIADTQNISKYKVEIIIDAPTIFSTLVKVDLKDE